MPPLSAAQVQQRSGGIGSSEIAAILDEDPWKGAIDVWLAKTGRAPEESSDFTRYGWRAEVLIADEFAERNGVELERCETTIHHENPIAVATPDRRIVGMSPAVLVECKNVGWRVLPRWRADSYTFRVPPYVLLQGQWQCGVVGATGFYVAAWLGGRDWHQEFVDFDAGLFGDLLVVAERFWRDHVVADLQPSPGGTERARALLERLYPRASAVLLPATDDVTELASAYARARAREAAAKKEKIAIGNKLCALIGDGGGFVGEWGQATWNAGSKGRTAWAAVAKEMHATADVITKHTKPAGRSLRVVVDGLEEDDGE